MKSQSTNELILSRISQNRSLTVHDLEIECVLSEPVIRYHLRKLLRLGVIQELENLELGLKAGRRYSLFRRTNTQSNQNNNELCSILLRLIFEISDRNDDDLIKTITDGMLAETVVLGSTHHISLRNMIDWLNQHHYSADWEAGKQGPIVRFANCPYRAIRSGNPILCKLDEKILRELTGRPWKIIQPMNWETLNGLCQFVVQPDACR